MIAAVANLSLARGTAYDVSLLIQDAAGVPLDLSAADLAATLKTGETVTSLDMTIAADGVVLVHIPPSRSGDVVLGSLVAGCTGNAQGTHPIRIGDGGGTD